LRLSGGFTSLLNRWQQQGDQDGNNRNHDKEFEQCKSTLAIMETSSIKHH
jgi:hypothetical protein